MPKKFVGSRVFGADSDDRLFIEKKQPRLAVVFYQPSADKLEESDKYESEAHYSTAKRKLLEVDAQKKRLTIFPVNTLEHHSDFLKPKYAQIESIIIEEWDSKLPKSEDDVSEMLLGLPAGFIKDFSYGLGFVKDYRFIITAIEKIPKVRHLLFGSGDSGVSGNTYYMIVRQTFSNLSMRLLTAESNSELVGTERGGHQRAVCHGRSPRSEHSRRGI
jgi:hypothetical protein